MSTNSASQGTGIVMHCITCGQEGHHYYAHWGLLGIEPVFAPGFRVVEPAQNALVTDERTEK